HARSVYTAGDYDAAATILFQIRDGIMHRQERAFQVYVYCAVPLVRLNLLHRCPHAVDARVCADDIELPELRYSGPYCSLHIIRLADIALQVERPPAHSLEL